MAKNSKKTQDKVQDVMHEYKEGTLTSSSGDKVTDRDQAIAIGLSEARQAGEDVPPAPESNMSSDSSSSSNRGGAKKSSSRKSSGKKAAKKAAAKKAPAKKAAKKAA